MSTDNMRVCAKALYFIHAPALTHTKHHRMIKINYIINLIIGPSESVRVYASVCFYSRLFCCCPYQTQSFLCVNGVRFSLCMCVCIFCCFPFPPSKHIKSSRLLFSQIIWPTSFGPHIHSFLHSDRRYHIRMAYASGENIFDAVILLFDKFQRKPMVRKWQHAHTQHTHTLHRHSQYYQFHVYGFLFIHSFEQK